MWIQRKEKKYAVSHLCPIMPNVSMNEEINAILTHTFGIEFNENGESARARETTIDVYLYFKSQKQIAEFSIYSR